MLGEYISLNAPPSMSKHIAPILSTFVGLCRHIGVTVPVDRCEFVEPFACTQR